MSIQEITSLLAQCQATHNDLMQFRPVRSKLIHLVSTIYDRKKYTDCGLNEKYFQKSFSDGYLKKAEDIVHRNYFIDFPATFARLKPLADGYLNEWSKVFQALTQYSSDNIQEPQLEEGIESFVQAHLKFSKQYIEDFKVHGRDTHSGTHLNYPETLKLFYCFIVEFLAEQPQLGAQLRDHLESCDQDAFLIVPHLCILQLLKHPDCQCPELLKRFEREISALRTLYVPLPDKELLEAALFDEKLVLAEKANSMRLELQKMSYRLHSQDLAQPFARCFRTLITELNEDFALAEQLNKEFTLNPKIVQPNVSGAVYALLHMPSQILEQLQSFLPTLKGITDFQDKFSEAPAEFRVEVQDFLYHAKRIDSDPSFMNIAELEKDLGNELKLYRLFGILQQVFKK